MKRRTSKKNRSAKWRANVVATVAAMVLPVGTGHAFEIDTGSSDVHVRWDTTAKYSAAFRTRSPSSDLTNSVNQDDGDRNFSKSLIQNRVDILSEFDVTVGDFGARVSGAAWYDQVYNNHTDNDSPGTFNPLSVSNRDFPKQTRDLHGRNVELLDAFVFGKTEIGDKPTTFRLGRHTLIYGESLFFGNNGIAAGQAPIDGVKALSVPNTPFKELMRPTNQISGQVQLSPGVSVSAYTQLEWEKTRIPGVGSYFSVSDVLDEGGERLIAGAPLFPGGGPLAFYRGRDQRASDIGQFGMQVRFTTEDTDYGFYAIRYHDKAPQLYLRPGALNPVTGQLGTYELVYPENIYAFGASANTTFGAHNVAAEISVRHNAPFVSSAQTVLPGMQADNDRHPLYAVGNSFHAQVSWLHTMSPNVLADEASVSGEVAYNRRLSISKNRAALDSNTTVDAMALRIVYEPTYRQVAPGLDLSVPIGLGYSPFGISSVVSNFGVRHGGDLTIGVNATYLDAWRAGLSFTHYFGPEGAFLDANSHVSGKQSMRDRDFVGLTVRRTF